MTGDRKIRLGFWLLTLIPVVIGLVAVQNAFQLVDASQDVARTNELVQELENFLSRLKDVEVAQREYVISGNDEYLKQIASLRTEVSGQLEQLSQMRPDVHWLELLKTLVPDKFNEIQRTVRLRRSGDAAGASAAVLPARGPQAMDDIRTVVRNMIAEENRLLQLRSGVQNAKFVNTMVIFGSVLLLNIILIWSLFYLVRRESSQVRQLNEELEDRVNQRTQELQRSNEDLQQFAYVASHDLKEPMRMISSYSTLLERRYQGQLGEDANTYIGFIVDGVKRMNALISDLLDYSRAGQMGEAHVKQVDPQAVFDAVLETFRMAIADTGATVTRDALPHVMYDPVRLAQLLQNLIGNALKYRGDRAPVIHVSASIREQETVFSITDNGIGLPPEHQIQVFGIFQRLHGKDVEGTGIGLATCKKIVEQHGGHIWVESVSGQGSTFRFSVPHAEAGMTSAASS
jgi:signal transduction histidine kinase